MMLTADPIEIMCEDEVTLPKDGWDGDALASLTRQAVRYGLFIEKANDVGWNWNSMYSVTVRGEEEDLRRYLDDVGYGSDQGWTWTIDGGRLRLS